MKSEIIPITRALPPVSAKNDGQGAVVERLCLELARVMELRRQSEQELQEIRARAIAQDKLAALGQLAACTAHEICQPLSFIRIFCDSFIKDSDAGTVPTSELSVEAKEACRQIVRIQKIIQETLHFARPASDSFVPQKPALLLERTLILMNPLLKRSGVKLMQSSDAGLLPIRGSAGMLEQIFVNLLQNAADALANQAEKKIHIRFRQQKRSLLISVCDNGPGVPEEIREKIFEPFFTTKA
ncbi:MAG: ATP-binding protein, partial [Desulfobulbaceae bacterium]|nr:ATP-binding protein [Desulfobulbaceae bacterium]